MERKERTTADLFEDFITSRIIKGCSQRTIMGYREAFGHYLVHSTGELSKGACRAYIVALVQSPMSTASKNHYIGHLRAFFYWLMEEEYIPPFKISLVRGQEPECKAYTQEEVSKLLVCNLRKCNYVEHRCYAIICFILATGARADTIINIKKEDIQGPYIKINTQKNKKASIIPLSPQIQKILRDFMHSWDTESEYLFCNKSEKKLSWNAIRLSMEDYFNKRGVRYKGVHSLRHTFAKMFILNGGNAFVLQKMLGHTTLAMTKRYCSLFGEDCTKEVDQFTPLDNIIKR